MRLPRAGKGDGVASRLWVTAAGIFLGLFLILSAIIWSGERASSDRRKAELREIHTQTVLLEAQHLLSALQDTETAERGYVITARPGFLEPYETGRKEVAASLNRLAEMNLYSPIQQTRIRELGRIIAAKIAEFSEIVALVQAGNQPGAVAIIMTERGMSRIEEARSIIGAAIAEEQRQQTLLSAAVDEAGNRDRRLSYALAAVGLLTLVGAAMAAVLALRQISRAQLSAQLIASEDRLRLLVERAPAAIAMFDKDMRYLLANRRYISDYRLHDAVDKGALINHSHYEVFPQCPQNRREIHRRVLGGETLCADDDEFPRADGSTDWVRWEMTPWHRADGTIGGAMLFSEVTTARKQVESRQALLLELACRLRTTPDETMDGAAALLGSHLSISRVGYGELDVTAKRITVGHEYRDGIAAAAIGTLDLSVLGAEIMEDLRAGRTLVVKDVVSDHRTRERSAPHQSMDTRSLIMVPLVRHDRLQALLYPADREPRAWTTGEVELIEEVAARTWAAVEQARMKVALERTAEEFLTLAEGLPMLCWMAEPDGHVYWYNQRWYDFTGTTPPEVEGWGWQSVPDPEVLPG